MFSTYFFCFMFVICSYFIHFNLICSVMSCISRVSFNHVAHWVRACLLKCALYSLYKLDLTNYLITFTGNNSGRKCSCCYIEMKQTARVQLNNLSTNRIWECFLLDRNQMRGWHDEDRTSWCSYRLRTSHYPGEHLASCRFVEATTGSRDSRWETKQSPSQMSSLKIRSGSDAPLSDPAPAAGEPPDHAHRHRPGIT